MDIRNALLGAEECNGYALHKDTIAVRLIRGGGGCDFLTFMLDKTWKDKVARYAPQEKTMVGNFLRLQGVLTPDLIISDEWVVVRHLDGELESDNQKFVREHNAKIR